ncbi:hypothetical protein H6G33_35310 [Calothrix sp. FACHB-1219]|nr:hypothetical protein [Calothrix sp. FACHB-168]MBD2222203.1 hypothetical protein [Calothrix sp. FACHB-1219]
MLGLVTALGFGDRQK